MSLISYSIIKNLENDIKFYENMMIIVFEKLN